MKKLVFLLVVIAGVYGGIANAILDAGTKSINSTQERMLKAGV